MQTGEIRSDLATESKSFQHTIEQFLDMIEKDPVALTRMTQADFARLGGMEGAEVIMWLVMRGALGGSVREVHRHYHVPASNSAAGLLCLESEETPP